MPCTLLVRIQPRHGVQHFGLRTRLRQGDVDGVKPASVAAFFILNVLGRILPVSHDDNG